MTKFAVALQPDHLERFTRNTSPARAISELIWNSCDADASHIEVIFDRNPLGAVDSITVRDDGSGLDPDLAVDAFKNFGQSWKSLKTHTKLSKRVIHGRNGEGRFLAFTLGEIVEWESVTAGRSGNLEARVRGRISKLDEIEIDKFINSNQGKTGTSVIITNLTEKGKRSSLDSVRASLTREFAPYLLNYPDVKIFFDGSLLKVEDFIKYKKDYILDGIPVGRENIDDAKLTIIEWNFDSDRRLIFCDESGFALHETDLRIQARGFNFSAYLHAKEFRRLADSGHLAFSELQDGSSKLLDIVKGKAKDHFRLRRAQESQTVVQKWKEEGIYPYENDPVTNVDVIERQVFDIVSSQISEYLPSFDKNAEELKRFQLSLIKQSLEESPQQLIKIVQEVLKLPIEKINELNDLLKFTSLSNIINSTKLVTDRLIFTQGLRDIIYDSVSKKLLKERTQLHRIIADNTWIFGEQYNLVVDDQSLNKVLIEHIKILKDNRTDLEGTSIDEIDNSPVIRPDGRKGIVDIMLSKSQVTFDGNLQHLVLELKRPSVKIDHEVLGQALSYAIAIAKDPRFDTKKTRWVFWAISNEMTDDALASVSEPYRPFGLYKEGVNWEVWAMTWGQIIQRSEERMGFLKKQLDFTPDSSDSIKFLREKYKKYLEGVHISSDSMLIAEMSSEESGLAE